MTVPANLNRVDYTGTGSAGPFTVPFPFYDASHLTVLQTDALFNQTTLTGWTATGAGGPSGAVTLAAACPVGSTLTILRIVPLTQNTSIKNQEAFYPEVHEQEMDLLAMADQQLDEAMDRTLRLPAGLSGVDMTLPRPDPGHALVWNAAGDGLENAGVASATLQQDLADSADVAKGDAMIAVKQPFTGAMARTQHDKNAEWVSVLDFGAVGDGVVNDSAAFTSAAATGSTVMVPAGSYKLLTSVNGDFVSSGPVTFPDKGVSNFRSLKNIPLHFSVKNYGVIGDGVTDDTSSFQAACDDCYAKKATLCIPADCVILITSTVTVRCSLVGAQAANAPVATHNILCGTNDFPALHIYGSRLRIENIGILYPPITTTLPTSAAAAFTLATTDVQCSKCIFIHCFSRWAYDGFRSVNTGPTGTMWMDNFINCHADFYTNIGFNLTCLNGSTTINLTNCFAIGTTLLSNEPKEAFYFSNISSVIMVQCANDVAYNRCIYAENIIIFAIYGYSVESSVFKVANSCVLKLVNTNAILKQIQLLASNINVGAGNRFYVVDAPAAGDYTVTIEGMQLSFNTITSGTLYKLRNNSIAKCSVLDDTVIRSEVYDNGYVTATSYKGVTYAPSTAYITTGYWEKGNRIYNSSVAVGQPKGWICTATGTPGTWVSEGNL